jgi:chromosomal replication initiation ATPase DnaA
LSYNIFIRGDDVRSCQSDGALPPYERQREGERYLLSDSGCMSVVEVDSKNKQVYLRKE